MNPLSRLTPLAPALLAVALAWAPRPASAQAYLGTSVGMSQFGLACGDATSCDRRGAAYKLFAGYMVSHNFAVEGLYYQHGKAHVTTTEAGLGEVGRDYRHQGLGVFALLIAPYSNKFSVFGKLGVVSSHVKLDSSAAGGSRSERHAVGAWGVGGGYDINPALGVRLEYERARVKFLGTKYDADMVTASALYRF